MPFGASTPATNKLKILYGVNYDFEKWSTTTSE
jgi:hypothetical protein